MYAGDRLTAETILTIFDPRELLPLLKWPKNELRHRWEKIEQTLMISLMWVKFSEDKYLRKRLLDTGNSRLIEDTPDPRWGRGVHWQGDNLHGKCLETVRRALQGSWDQLPSKLLITDQPNIRSVPNYQIVFLPSAQISCASLLSATMSVLPSLDAVIWLFGHTDLFPDRASASKRGCTSGDRVSDIKVKNIISQCK